MENENVENEVPEGFIKAVNFVIDNADVILDTLSSLAKDYIIGRDIRDILRNFKDYHNLLFQLISDIFSKNEKVLELLDKIVEEDKKWIFSKIRSYSILNNEFEAIKFEDYGYVNFITRIRNEIDYNEELELPFLKLEFFSFNKKLLHFKEDTGGILWLTLNLIEKVLECFKEYKNKPINEESATFMKDRLKDIIKYSEDAIKMLEEFRGERNE